MTAIIPRTSLTIRPAIAGDLAFIDRLQQMHSKAVGFMPTKQLEQKIARGEVLMAEDRDEGTEARRHEGRDEGESREVNSLHPSLPSPPLRASVPPSLRASSLGYCIASDRYFKRDEVGIIYQMNVTPGAQRKLIAASLLKATFERAPYGCKLFCCWCAQDLAANYFWQSMGFVPLAFRTGAVGKKVRTHIFWQRRIREGDESTPFWYPCKTDGGSMREDRLVLPIPPGVNWSDEMPVLIPEVQNALPAPSKKAAKEKATPVLMPPTRRGARFGPPGAAMMSEPAVEPAKVDKPKRAKIKADPKHVAAARELRDRYLEQFNNGALPSAGLPSGKYEVTRAIGGPAIKALPQPQAA